MPYVILDEGIRDRVLGLAETLGGAQNMVQEYVEHPQPPRWRQYQTDRWQCVDFSEIQIHYIKFGARRFHTRRSTL